MHLNFRWKSAGSSGWVQNYEPRERAGLRAGLALPLPGWPETIITLALHYGNITIRKMAANLNTEFWRCINELQIQLQSLNRIEGFQKQNKESEEGNIVKPKTLSR